MHHTRIIPLPLTQPLPTQMLPPRPQRPIHIMILSRKNILPCVFKGVKSIAPVTVEVEPFYRGFRVEGRRGEGIGAVVVVVGEGVEGRVPEGAAVGLVVEETEGEDVGVAAGRGVHCVGADCGVYHWPFPEFLNCVIGVCLAEKVLAQEHVFGFPVVESDESVFPVSDVVAEADVEDEVAEVVAVEEEPECVDDAVAFFDYEEDCGGIATSALYLSGLVIRQKWFLDMFSVRFFRVVGDVFLST